MQGSVRVEAVVVVWDPLLAPAGDRDALRSTVGEAVAAGLDLAIIGTDRPVTDTVTWVEAAASGPGQLLVADLEQIVRVAPSATITLARCYPPGSSTAVATVFADLWGRGVGPGLVLVAVPEDGVPPLPASAARARLAGIAADPTVAVRQLQHLLDEQLALRRARCVPDVDRDPAWSVVLELDENGHRARLHASLLALSNGLVGTRGDVEHLTEGSSRLVLVNGAFGRGADDLIRPLPGPTWTHLSPDPGIDGLRAVLDLRTGVLVREALEAGSAPCTARFVSLVRPGVVGLRTGGAGEPVAPLGPPVDDVGGHAADHDHIGRHEPDGTWWARTTSDRATVGAWAWQASDAGPDATLERLVVYGRATDGTEPELRSELRDVVSVGFDGLLREHRAAWAERWADAEVGIHGDPELELAVRFAIFHLLGCAPTAGEATVGARGLTGLGYAGHVFWDTDVFVLPALVAILPAAARAVLEYRIRRLPAARAAAARRGCDGARFPWESADTGEDVTPPHVRDLDGRFVPIPTGDHEEHITADVAWALLCYVDWTGDVGLLSGPGRALLVDTARYWASRIRRDNGGRAHLYGVIGPDEYHEVVDDNAYTNVLVRWHLRRAAALVDPDTAAAWRELAGALVDGYDAETGRHEQFAGFWSLEPLLIGEVAEPPVAADVLLGRERVARSQVIKQPDVLMAHQLVTEELPAGSLAADLDFYLPRTAHGSSLSPAICASLLARAGRPDEALELFEIAARIDLDDLTGTTAGGLHLATMGGLWQALATGFAGVRPGPTALGLEPCLPERWDRLELRLVFRGVPVRLALAHDRICVDAPSGVPVAVHGQHARAPARFERTAIGWRRIS